MSVYDMKMNELKQGDYVKILNNSMEQGSVKYKIGNCYYITGIFQNDLMLSEINDGGYPYFYCYPCNVLKVTIEEAYKCHENVTTNGTAEVISRNKYF